MSGWMKWSSGNKEMELGVMECWSNEKKPKQRIPEANRFERLDSQAYKLENGLLKLVESLERKHDQGDRIDHLVVKESNAIYGKD